MNDMARLAQLASNPQDTTREELYLAVASLYRVQDNHLNPRERDLMRDILRRLTGDVEMTIRIALAERLAEDADAPHDLILMLADDRIEVARPVLLRSPLLSDEDMLKLVVESGSPHQEVLATRAHIGEAVSEALSKCESETVLIALVRNLTAKISAQTFETLVERSRHIEAMHAPLAHRPDLPPALATKMCEWVSDVIKDFIVRNYAMEPERLQRALSAAGGVVTSEPPQAKTPPAESAQKLIDKLYLAGQLKPGFLLRVLHQGQIDLFDLGFARLLEMTLIEMRHTLYERGPRGVALACRAVGIDRCVFTTVFNLSRHARSIRAALSEADRREVAQVFEGFTRTEALTALRTQQG